MHKVVGTDNEMEEVLEALSGYLETLDHIEILFSRKRGYLILRWDSLAGKYYGIHSVGTPDELALYIYGELVSRITVETKSDHSLKAMDFSDTELEEAKVITKKFLEVLPEKVRERMDEMIDPDSRLLPDIRDSLEEVLE